jgi:hypothetical protein
MDSIDLDINNYNLNDLYNLFKIPTGKTFKGMRDTYYTNNTTNLDRNQLDDYSSDVFSKLKYEDIKKAHTETVILIDENDIHKREQYKNVDDFIIARKQQENIPELNTFLNKIEEEKQREKFESMNRSYNMVKQMEQIKKQNNIFMSSLKMLE